jgi:hypothetical protein
MRRHFIPTLRCFLSCFVSYVMLILFCAPFSLSAPGGRARKVRSSSPVSRPSPQTRGGHRSGELLVRFRSGVTEQDKAIVFLSNGAQRQKQLRGESGIEKLSIPAGQDPDSNRADNAIEPAG